jgi:hypothetical protein
MLLSDSLDISRSGLPRPPPTPFKSGVRSDQGRLHDRLIDICLGRF